MAEDESGPKRDPRADYEKFTRGLDDSRPMYRPLEAFITHDIGKQFVSYPNLSDRENAQANKDVLSDPEKEQIKNELSGTVLNTFLTFSENLRLVIEATAAKKDGYSAQHALERANMGIAQTKELIYSAKESEANEVVLGAVLSDQVVNKSILTIYSWANPYLSMYWAGMDSLRLIMERGMQLPMADMNRLFKGPTGKKLKERISRAGDEIKKWIPNRKTRKVAEQTPTEIVTKEKEESFGERMGRYVSETYFWTQIRGEMNTFNPTFGVEGFTRQQSEGGYVGPDGKVVKPTAKESLNISATMQEFVHRLSNTSNREKADEEPSLAKKIVIFYDENGKQIREQDATTTSRRVELYNRTLDYFNTAKSEKDRKWLIATTAAMAMHDTKTLLELLPQDIRNENMRTKEDWDNYAALYKRVKATAVEIYENFDLADKSFLEHQMAVTAFDLSYAFAFGSFSVADWGWSYEWKHNSSTGLWSFEAAQGDPTASGDAFTARRPYFHEVVYAAIKDRASAPKGGAMMAIDGSVDKSKGETEPQRALDLANALVSEIEQANQKGEMIARIKKGEQLHLARFFGTIGAFKEVFYTGAMQKSSNRGEVAAFNAWKEGLEIRNKASKGLNEPKVANPNFIKTVEKMIVFVPTPYVDKTTGEKLVFPMIMPQFQISMIDMLRVDKHGDSAGDILRKLWVKDETTGEYRKPKAGEVGKRLTLQDIDWENFGPYGDDSRAVSNNFMSQLYGPIYGAPNPKSIEGIVANPAQAVALATKAADIATRQQAIVVDEDATTDSDKFAQRPSFEIIYSVSDVFNNMAFGGAGLIGRGAVGRMDKFLEAVSVGAMSEGKTPNLYVLLRSVEDQLGTKQGYEHFSDSFYLLFMGMMEALKPITIASDDMAEATTSRMKDSDALGHQQIVDKYKGKKYT